MNKDLIAIRGVVQDQVPVSDMESVLLTHKTAIKKSIDEIIADIELNYEDFSFLSLIFLDFKVFFQFLVITVIIAAFVFSLIYIWLSEKSPVASLSVTATLIALVALVEANKGNKDRMIREAEIRLNLKKIENYYSNEELFRINYPIIKALLILKQKNPDISLYQLREFNKNIFTEEALMEILSNKDF